VLATDPRARRPIVGSKEDTIEGAATESYKKLIVRNQALPWVGDDEGLGTSSLLETEHGSRCGPGLRRHPGDELPAKLKD